MLNRTAESMYWMGRYLERAENHVRFLDAHFHIRYSAHDEDVWHRVVATLADPPLFLASYTGYAQQHVLRFLTLDDTCDNSVISCIAQARANVRNVRDKLPTELWDTLNGLYLWLKKTSMEDIRRESPRQFYKVIREKLAAVRGTSDAVVPRENAWHLMECGRFLERGESSIRILRAFDEPDASKRKLYNDYLTILTSVGGYEAFRRDYLDAVKPETVMEFILMNETFPRSVMFSMSSLLQHVSCIDDGLSRSGTDHFIRTLKRIAAELSCLDRVDLTHMNASALLENLSQAFTHMGNAMSDLLLDGKGAATNETRNLPRHALYVLEPSDGECQ